MFFHFPGLTINFLISYPSSRWAIRQSRDWTSRRVSSNLFRMDPVPAGYGSPLLVPGVPVCSPYSMLRFFRIEQEYMMEPGCPGPVRENMTRYPMEREGECERKFFFAGRRIPVFLPGPKSNRLVFPSEKILWKTGDNSLRH